MDEAKKMVWTWNKSTFGETFQRLIGVANCLVTRLFSCVIRLMRYRIIRKSVFRRENSIGKLAVFREHEYERIDGGSWIKYVLGKIEFKRVWAGKRERKRDSKCTLSKIAYTWRDTLWIATRISVLPPEGRNFPSRSNSYSYYLDTSSIDERPRREKFMHSSRIGANKSLSLSRFFFDRKLNTTIFHVNYSAKRE